MIEDTPRDATTAADGAPSAPPASPTASQRSTAPRRSARRTWIELAIVAVVGAVICLLAVPAPFTIDEDNYLVTVLAAQHGQLAVPGTENLPPSKELRYFCPQARSFAVQSTPVYSRVPPLYAFVALPFSYLGWYGLVFINALAYTLTAYLVYRHLKRVSRSPHAPWIGLTAVGIGTFFLEYAQGLWPHMLCVLLTFAAYSLVQRTLDESRWLLALPAGLLVAAAVGIRYQNVLLVLALGSVVLAFSTKQRWLKSAAFGAGAAVPLALNSVINHLRFGSWNPISKGGGYLAVTTTSQHAGPDISVAERFLGPLRLFWGRTVDFTTRPPGAFLDSHDYIHHDLASGIYAIGPSLKKALLQSAPWLVLPLAALVAVWLLHREFPHRRELRTQSICVYVVLVAFSLASPNRTDGLCFNQRYLLELLPILAVGTALVLDNVSWNWRAAVLGAAVPAIPMLVFEPSPASHPLLFMKAPLLCAAALLAAWVSRTRVPSTWHVWGLMGMAVGWAFAVHLSDDVTTSRRHRLRQHALLEVVGDAIPDYSAVFAWHGNKDPFGALQLERDIVLLDPAVDQGQTAPALATALAHQGRRVFVLLPGMPQSVVSTISGGRRPKVVLLLPNWGPLLLEVQHGARHQP